MSQIQLNLIAQSAAMMGVPLWVLVHLIQPHHLCLNPQKGNFTAQLASPTSSVQPNTVQAPDQKPSAISQPFRSEDDFRQSIWFNSPPGDEEGSRQKQLKASSKAVNSKFLSLVTCQIKSFKSITKLSLVVKNGSIRGKLKGAEVDMEGVVMDQNKEIQLISQRLMEANKSSSEEEMMSPRCLYRQPQAIRKNRSWNSWIKEEHLVRIENQASINQNFYQPGQKGDTKEWLKEQYMFQESLDKEELKEMEDYCPKRRLQRKKKKRFLKNSAEQSTVEVEEKGWKTMLMRGKSIGRPIKGNLKNRMAKV
ncbi:hypothetical protein BY996DRAFT_6411600 [Phakopsora pachyrhizi]|nr:hypothetical protein BY996DRAFT_6411600 [Phakopsora pachyrhizi]